MSPLWLSLHLVGFVAWMGGLFSVLAIAPVAAREDPAALGMVARLEAGIYRVLVGPGAMLTVVSGMILTLRMYNEATAVGLSHALMLMQALGLVAGLVALIVSVPTASRLARLEPVGPSAGLFAQLRKRLRLTDWIVLWLSVASLVAGAAGRQ